ncbi:MAG: ribonuclease H family protein [Bacteroidales bacterium]|nr:ribonuclease H family protein [Clostridium sp.]MCM1204327.1 ribonuclease H family protein [Bacteroidales bacterium]
MGKKYYAVARGRTPGIYFSWEDCRAQVEQFSGAAYKGCGTIAEAEDFIRKAGEDGAGFPQEERAKQEEAESRQVSTDSHLVAYVDGSYEHGIMRYAYGCVLVFPEEEILLKGSGQEEDYVTMRNVAGEILGSECAVNWALEHGYRAVTIYYDYEGIEKWANGSWKANKPGTKRYQAFIAEKRKAIEITFKKVAAHTGVKYNEMADRLAKEALGL